MISCRYSHPRPAIDSLELYRDSGLSLSSHNVLVSARSHLNSSTPLSYTHYGTDSPIIRYSYLRTVTARRRTFSTVIAFACYANPFLFSQDSKLPFNGINHTPSLRHHYAIYCVETTPPLRLFARSSPSATSAILILAHHSRHSHPTFTRNHPSLADYQVLINCAGCMLSYCSLDAQVVL